MLASFVTDMLNTFSRSLTGSGYARYHFYNRTNAYFLSNIVLKTLNKK